MSKLYDDLKRRGGKEEIDSLDLFAYAAKKAQPVTPPASPPHAEPEPAVVEIETPSSPVEPEAMPPVDAPIQEPLPKHEPAKSSEPLYRGLSPLSGVRPPPPHEEDRRVVAIAVVAVCGLLVLAFLVVGIARGLSRVRPVDVVTSVKKPAEVVPPKPAKVKPVLLKVRPASATAAKPVELGGKGMVVTAEGTEKIVVFEEGVFTSGAKLSRQGEAMLSKVGRQLAPHARNISITVVGCTDNLPVSGKKEYKDNQTLGLMRAAAALKVLQSSSGVPSSAFKTVSRGTEWSPFPNDTAASRARNRTVVLRIAGL